MPLALRYSCLFFCSGSLNAIIKPRCITSIDSASLDAYPGNLYGLSEGSSLTKSSSVYSHGFTIIIASSVVMSPNELNDPPEPLDEF